jgi:hypothetical protein
MKPFTTIAAAIFLLMALVHAYRLITEFPIVIGGALVGQAISWVALVITADPGNRPFSGSPALSKEKAGHPRVTGLLA